MNDWDHIRQEETVIYGNYPSGAHESLLRSFHVLREVREMLERGDSTRTIAMFIDWATESGVARAAR